MKCEKHTIDDVDDEMMQHVSEGDVVDNADDVDNNADHADA